MPRKFQFGLIALLIGGVGYWGFHAYQNQRLMLAAHRGSISTAESALRWGAEVNQSDSPIASAARMQLLYRTASDTSESGSGRAYHNLIQLLLHHGAEINNPDHRGYTALDYLVQTGSLQDVKAVVERGADVNSLVEIPGHDPHPLILAASARDNHDPNRSLYDYNRVIEYLVENGADVNAEDHRGHTALYYVAGQSPGYVNHPLLVKLLLAAGAEVNPKRPDFGPLHQAARNGRPSIVRVLLQHGADVNQSHRPPGEGGYTPAFMAAYFMEAGEEDRVKVLRLLIDAGAQLDLAVAGKPPIRESPLVQRAMAMTEDQVATLYRE